MMARLPRCDFEVDSDWEGGILRQLGVILAPAAARDNLTHCAQLCTHGMANVFEIHRLSAIRAGHAFYCLVQDIGNRDGTPIAVALNLDWPRLDAQEVTDQRTELSDGSASLTAANRGERVLLFG